MAVNGFVLGMAGIAEAAEMMSLMLGYGWLLVTAGLAVASVKRRWGRLVWAALGVLVVGTVLFQPFRMFMWGPLVEPGDLDEVAWRGEFSVWGIVWMGVSAGVLGWSAWYGVRRAAPWLACSGRR